MTYEQLGLRFEAEELELKLALLKGYFATKTYAALPVGDQALLTEQEQAMDKYISVLRRRIGRFPKTK